MRTCRLVKIVAVSLLMVGLMGCARSAPVSEEPMTEQQVLEEEQQTNEAAAEVRRLEDAAAREAAELPEGSQRRAISLSDGDEDEDDEEGGEIEIVRPSSESRDEEAPQCGPGTEFRCLDEEDLDIE
jgi:hypothetical protein